MIRRNRLHLLVAAAAGTGLMLAGCQSGSSQGEDAVTLTIGTTDKVTSIDPAGSYDNGSLMVQNQVYQYLMNFAEGSTELSPDAAESCEFVDPVTFRCTIKDGLTFANGNDLTASDVAFSFQRIVEINDANGPASLLSGMESVEALDDSTVQFTLTLPNDQTFPQVLATSAGPIVDEETYPADAVLSDDDAVEAQGFSGAYTITEYEKGSLAQFSANPDYDGTYGTAKTQEVALVTYADSNNLKLDVAAGKIDVAYRTLTPTDIESLGGDDRVTVHTGAGGALRFIMFNFSTMPGADDAQKLAIRQAVAATIDREELATQVYKGSFTPAYSAVPEGQLGAIESFAARYGEKPDIEAARKTLEDAGLTIPVALPIQYNPDHYGSSSTEEYALIKRQLEASGLFTVDLQSTEWVTYIKDVFADKYPIFQLGWTPDFPDADNYVTPFFSEGSFPTHYVDPRMAELLNAQKVETDTAKRTELLGQIQDLAAENVPILPLLTGSQIAVAGTDVKGVAETLDASFKFRFSSLSK